GAGTGRGGEVVVELPLAAGKADLAYTAPAGATSSLAGLSILVVEDSEDARESLRILLQFLGAEVSVARDGREALDVTQEAEPDVVLCDLRMPRMDGFEFIRELHRQPSVSPPVLAVSAYTSDADLQRTREAGF